MWWLEMGIMKLFFGMIVSCLVFNRAVIYAADPPGEQSNYSRNEYSSIFHYMPQLFGHVFHMLEENPKFLEQVSANMATSDDDSVKVINRGTEPEESEYQEIKEDEASEERKKVKRDNDCDDDADNQQGKVGIQKILDKYRI